MDTITKPAYFFAKLLLILTSVCVGIAQANENVERDLLKRIEQSQSALQAEEASINKEKRDYAAKLARLEKQVAQLRQNASGIQRQADENLLSLQKLQTRLAQWQDQRDYQRHMLQRHAESFGLTPEDSAQDVVVLEASLARADETLNPQWRSGDIALSSGQFAPAQFISVGPAQLFLTDDGNTSGLYATSDQAVRTSAYIFSGSRHSAMERLWQTGIGAPSLDPTQGRALEIERHKESTWDHIQKGGLWTLPIVLFGLIAFVIAIIKAAQLMRLPQPSAVTLRQLDKLIHDNSEQARKRALTLFGKRYQPFRRLVEIVVKQPVSQQRDDMLYNHVTQVRRTVTKYLDLIALTAAVAPLLGLLGTVSGMIKTFKMLTIFGSGDPAAVSGGISEALITTELGLIVAIPALVINAFLSRKAKAYMHRLEETAISISTTKAS